MKKGNPKGKERLTDALRDWDIIAAVRMVAEGERGVESGGEKREAVDGRLLVREVRSWTFGTLRLGTPADSAQMRLFPILAFSPSRPTP